MSSLLHTGGNLLTKAMALKAGKFIWKKGGIAGIAIIGAGYLAYHLISKQKNDDLTRIDDIEDNNHEVKGDKKIVV